MLETYEIIHEVWQRRQRELPLRKSSGDIILDPTKVSHSGSYAWVVENMLFYISKLILKKRYLLKAKGAMNPHFKHIQSLKLGHLQELTFASICSRRMLQMVNPPESPQTLPMSQPICHITIYKSTRNKK